MLHAYTVPSTTTTCPTPSVPVRARWHMLFLAGVWAMAIPAAAQEANTWYFGARAGLDFNSGTPVTLLDGMMMSYEASGSISDANGDLLFYTNAGRVMTSDPYRYGYVYDSNHNVMPNGDLELSGGCNSAKQGALIVQDPGNTDHYYIFTLDCAEHGVVGGLRYCEVDMTLNGGLGDVTSIANPLLSDVTESMIGIRHANGFDVWVLVHGLDNSDYHAFLVTAAGITGPVTTTIGPMVDDQPGDMAVNLTSTKVHYSSTNNSILLDFDPSTGVLSNLLDLDRNVVGCAFAPGGQYLYTCEFLGTKRIFQYDLLAADILASEQIITAGGNAGQPSLRLAPNGKIYVAHWEQDHLGVINNPDAQGLAADYQYQGVALLGRNCNAGLPEFVNDLLIPFTAAIADAPSVPTIQCMVTGDELLIRFGADMAQGRLSIFRSDGTLMHEDGMRSGQATIPIAWFAAGHYVVRLTTNEHSATGAFYIVR
ncbi:MAG: hypothetical protein IPG10_16560 [Flavobacteriales bacterium]|nr:hypothetical protein [Flavobacteriales bacterium]